MEKTEAMMNRSKSFWPNEVSSIELVAKLILVGALKGILVSKPVVLGSSAFLTDDSLLDYLHFDEFNAGCFVWKPINEIDDVHGQNRLF